MASDSSAHKPKLRVKPSRRNRDGLLERQGRAISNFTARLPKAHVSRAQQSLKDPYLFDFLGLDNEAKERDIEDARVRNITRFCQCCTSLTTQREGDAGKAIV